MNQAVRDSYQTTKIDLLTGTVRQFNGQEVVRETWIRQLGFHIRQGRLICWPTLSDSSTGRKLYEKHESGSKGFISDKEDWFLDRHCQTVQRAGSCTRHMNQAVRDSYQITTIDFLTDTARQFNVQEVVLETWIRQLGIRIRQGRLICWPALSDSSTGRKLYGKHESGS